MQTVVVAGSASGRLGSRLAQALGCPLADTEIKRFPDGEVYARLLTGVAGAHVVCVQSTAPNDNLVELLLLQDAAREAGAAQVTTVVPYYGYARQDRVFKDGEAVSARAAARAIATTSDRLLVVDPHKDAILDFFDGPAAGVTAVPQLAATLGSWGVDAILAPDAGARDRAAAAAAVLGVPHDHLEKTRLGPTEVVMKAKALDVAGKRVAIVDDMIASGGTMVTAAGQLKANGATAVYAACTHGIFTGGAVPKLLAGGIDRVLATDSVEQPAEAGCDEVSAADAVAEALAAQVTA
ncbi:MAG: ribose-phosphate diphosphokinase [Thermoplasmatota archaeon]